MVIKRNVCFRCIADVSSALDNIRMDAVSPELRLSAQRALLGALYPEVRLVKIKRTGSTIIMTSILETVREESVEALSAAATEIIADFPDCERISEQVFVSDAELPKEDVLAEGWLYQRAEG